MATVKPARDTRPRRTYRSALREAQAARTRRTVLDAAGELFASAGYAATTVDAIAQHAGVSPETVYRTFGSKRALLARWIDTRVVGDDAPIPLIERPEIEAVRAERDPDTRLARAAAFGRRVHERSAGAVDALRSAAASDGELAALWSEMRSRGRADARSILELIAGDRGLRPDVDLEEAVDFFDALIGPETYLFLVERHGWTGDRYERWLVHVTKHALLDAPAG